jgi:hypothetical protein
MIGTFGFQAFAIAITTMDFKDHEVVEEIGAGESETMVAVGLSEVNVG